MRVAERVVHSIHLLVSQSFAKEKFFLEASLLTFAVAESEVLMLGVDQRAFRVMFVSAEIIEELLVRAIHHHMTLVLDVLVVDLRHTKRVGLGVFIVTTQNASTHDILVQNIQESHAHHVVAL